MEECKCMKEIEDRYPLSKKNNPRLFEEVCQYMLIMGEVSKRMSVPQEELLEFFYKGKIKIDLINEQEEVLRKHGKGDTSL